MKGMDALIEAHIGVNINVYEDSVNNDIFMGRVITRFNKVKEINNHYEESRTSINIIEESIRKRTEMEIQIEAAEEYRRVFGHYPYGWEPIPQS